MPVNGGKRARSGRRRSLRQVLDFQEITREVVLGIRNDEVWLWLEDAPSEFDLAELCRRKQSWRLGRVNPSKPFILMGQIRQLLEKRLNARPYADRPSTNAKS